VLEVLKQQNAHLERKAHHLPQRPVKAEGGGLTGQPNAQGEEYGSREGSSNGGGREGAKSVVGKLTISFGEPDAVYDRAIRSHEFHNKKMGYSQFVLRERVMSGLWSKHAYIISTLVQELAKPEAERLQWLMSVLPLPHARQRDTDMKAGGSTAILCS